MKKEYQAPTLQIDELETESSLGNFCFSGVGDITQWGGDEPE